MKYASLRHEATSLQAIRIAHYVARKETSWDDSFQCRQRYWKWLQQEWKHLSSFCLLGAEIERLYLFNPTDLGRWVGGGPFAVSIEGSRRSRLLPAAFVLTACGGIEIDSHLRDVLSTARNGYQFQVMSWVGFRPDDHALFSSDVFDDGVDDLRSPFRRIGPLPVSDYVALILFQCRSPQNLDDIDAVFEGICKISVGNGRDKVSWRPAIIGLLKGNVDAFAVLERGPPERGTHAGPGEFDELVIRLESQRTGSKFWDGIRPVALYGGKGTSWVDENWDLLDTLPDHNGRQGVLAEPVKDVDDSPLEPPALDPPESEASPATPGLAKAGNRPPASPPLAT